MEYFVENNINVVDISGTYQTRMAFDDAGNVYAWGRGYYGEMGAGVRRDNNPIPSLVPGLPKIARIITNNG